MPRRRLEVTDAPTRPLLNRWPRLREALPWLGLGELPTPVEREEIDGRALFIKRDDRSSPVYGGNKVRTLELLLADARSAGARRIYATGAYGSNHAIATALHAPRVGLEAGAALFPQPPSLAARENLTALLARRPALVDLPHWAGLPAAMVLTPRKDAAQGIASIVMPPGGATPLGALGYVNAALELAEQVGAGALPCPGQVVVGVGSTCTSAGLLLGFRLAAELNLGWTTPPRLVSVRVTPWPVTSAWRIALLAREAGRELARRAGDDSLGRHSARSLLRGLELEGGELGWGYGRATRRGQDTMRAFRRDAGLALDTTYSAKAAAGALARAGRAPEDRPVLFWSTKSTAPLRVMDPPSDIPERMRRWLARPTPY